MKDRVKIYLYGNPSFKVSENQLTLLATTKIHKRFISICKGGLTIFQA